MPEVGRGVQLQRAIFVSYCQKEGGGKPAFKINLTPMGAAVDSGVFHGSRSFQKDGLSHSTN